MNTSGETVVNPFTKTGLQRTPTKLCVVNSSAENNLSRAESEPSLSFTAKNSNFSLKINVRKTEDNKVQTGIDRYLKRKMSPSNNNVGNAAKKQNAIPLSNRFDALTSANDNDEPADVAAYKPAPIYLRQAPTKTVIDLIKKATNNNNFSCRNIQRGNINETKVQCNNIDDYRKVVTALDTNNMKYYTYRLKMLRGLTVVIKGIESDVDPEEIKAALNEKGFEVVSVINIINRFKKPQPLFKVELQPETRRLKPGEVHPIYKVNRLISRVITIEEPRKRTGPVQCHNCQEYGHTRGYCKLPAICVACSGTHETKKCPISKNEPETKKCSNCGGNHTANYRGCPVYTSLKNKPQEPRQNVANRPPTQQPTTLPKQPPGFATTLPPSTSYRDALLSQPSPIAPPADQLQIFMSSMMQLMTSMQTMMQEMLRSQQLLIQKLQASK